MSRTRLGLAILVLLLAGNLHFRRDGNIGEASPELRPPLERIKVVVPREGGREDEWEIREPDRLSRMQSFVWSHRDGWTDPPLPEAPGMEFFAKCEFRPNDTVWIAIALEDGPDDPFWLVGKSERPHFDYRGMLVQKVSREEHLELLDILNVHP